MTNCHNKVLKPIAIYLAILSDLNTNCKTMETINNKIVDECLDNVILDAINTIKKIKIKKRPDASSIYTFIHKNWKNYQWTNNDQIENKSSNGKSFAFAPVLPSAVDQSIPLPVNCEIPSAKNKQ